MSIDLRVIALSLHRLAELRCDLSFEQRLHLGEKLRDCADALDHGGRLGDAFVWEPDTQR